MTNKSRFFNLLLAGTFLSCPAMADFYSNVPKTEFGSGSEKIYFEPIYKNEPFLKPVEKPTEGKTVFTINFNPEDIKTDRIVVSENTKDISGVFGDIEAPATGNYDDDINIFGGAIYNEINSGINISGTFILNGDDNIYGDGYGGAISNSKTGVLGDISGVFVGNYARGEEAGGAAISNAGVMGDISGDFIGNIAEGNNGVWGGAIVASPSQDNYEDSQVGTISGNFIGNGIMGFVASGGAVMVGDVSDRTINIENADFYNNFASGDYTYGGAIYGVSWSGGGVIAIKNSKFYNNMGYGGYEAVGGAVSLETGGKIINSAFEGNSITGQYATAGALFNGYYTSEISGSFKDNVANGEYQALGGAVSNGYGGAWGEEYVTIDKITADFVNNGVNTAGFDGATAVGGAISNFYDNGYDSSIHHIGEISNSNFIGNYADAAGFEIEVGSVDVSLMMNPTPTVAAGGAIANINGTIGKIVNSNFIDNYVVADVVWGGAIASTSDLTIVADNGTSTFSGNRANDISNAIFMMGEPPVGPASLEPNSFGVQLNDAGSSSNGLINLNFEAVNDGTITIDDTIAGEYYNINISGDVCENCFVNSVAFNNVVFGAQDITLDTTQMVLGKNAIVAAEGNYEAVNNPILRVELDASTGEAGKLIAGDIIGTTKVIVDTKNYKDIRGQDSIVFAAAGMDNGEANEKSFEIFRVIGSPYKYKIDYQTDATVDISGSLLEEVLGITEIDVAKVWGVSMTDEENTYTEDCDPKEDEEDTPSDSKPLGPIEVEPEIVAMEALPSAAIAQTNGMIYNIMRKVNVNRLYCPGCGFYDYNWNGEAFHNLWVDTTYNGLEIDAPVEIEAKVWGIEAGSDIQRDLHNKLGIFVSYRQGNYEMDGKGDKYFAKLGSELDIDSYLAGLYYRYDNNNWYAFATLYGGMQEAEINTDDGVSTDTDGIEFGGSAEVGYSYALNKTVYVTPSLGVFYTQVSYDDASDNYGKTVEYNDLKQVELEAGLKLSKAVYTDNGAASIYVKPSVVQTLVDGDEVTITEIGKVDTIDDETLGRIEIGGNYGFNDNWSAYGWANYTFGSDYEATSVGAGVNYAW